MDTKNDEYARALAAIIKDAQNADGNEQKRLNKKIMDWDRDLPGVLAAAKRKIVTTDRSKKIDVIMQW